MNLGHLYFDIVSDLGLRISDFASPGIFTLVEDSLQISPFMQNEPNFPDDPMNVNKVLTKDYEKKSNWTLGENEPKTNPIYPVVASGEAGTNPIYRGIAFGEAGTKPTCRGVASGEAGSKAKNRAGAGMTESSNRQYHTIMYPIYVD